MDCSNLLSLISRRTAGSPPAYWARHFACALDMFQLHMAAFQYGQITTESGAMSSLVSRVLFPSVKKNLREFTSPEHKPGEEHAPIPILL